jgi:hypothetical protein
MQGYFIRDKSARAQVVCIRNGKKAGIERFCGNTEKIIDKYRLIMLIS